MQNVTGSSSSVIGKVSEPGVFELTSVPCANCVRRECADLCPDSIKVKKA